MLDLTADEAIMLVTLVNQVPDNTMIFHENVLHTMQSHPVCKSLIEKIEVRVSETDVMDELERRMKEASDGLEG